ncbi:MAG TPA: Rieske (2Fe-2S) protein [Anaerolineales bacterium]|nr:Rieske (2Fe-2S) protein [Anaerolineales bacterium]
MSDITRSDFLKLLKGAGAIAGVGLFASPVISYFYPPKLEEMPSEPVLVCPENELLIGEAKTVKFGRYPALVINLDGELKAYSAVCTHFACLVKWDKESGELVCPCHEGTFNASDGSVISGPPPTPLLKLETEINEGNIFVKVGDES